jgi:ABC-type antimicrobial peptide transport system permease subunit
VGAAERTLAAVAAFVVLTGLVSILTAVLTSLNERRREMAILRALGARPHHVFILLVAESAVLALAGALIGPALTYAGLTAFAPMLEARFGILASRPDPRPLRSGDHWGGDRRGGAARRRAGLARLSATRSPTA